MPYFLMFLQVALNRLRMNYFKRPGNSQLQHPQKLVVIELIIVAFMVFAVGVHACSSSVSLPQYLQADFNKIVTVTGVATQGDALRNNRVTSYLIRYGYDGKTWISYGAGQVNLQHVFIYLSEDLLKGTSRSFSPTFSFRARLLYFFSLL